MAVHTGQQLFYSSTAVQTTVAASITSSGTSIELTAVTGWPTQFPCKLLLEWGTANQEVAYLTQAATGSGPYTFANCLRGQDGTTGVSHSSGAQANHGISAGDFFQIAPVFNVCGYGADPTGTNDSTSVIQAAVTDCISAGGGTVYIPEGTYKTSSTVTAQVNDNPVAIYGAPGATIEYYGSGDCIRMYDSSTYSTRAFGVNTGIYGYLVIDGTHSSASAVSTGLHIGDIFQLGVFCTAKNFSQFAGSIGVHFDNNYYWTEQLNARIYTQTCGTGVMFDNSANTSGSATGSYDRIAADLFIDTNGVGDGVTFTNGAQAADMVKLGIFGNANTSTTQYAVLRITGSTGGNYSSIAYGNLNIGVELDDTTHTAPYTVYFGSGSNYVIASGSVDFSLGDAFTSSNNAGQFTVIGPCYGDAALPSGIPKGITNLADSNQTISATSPANLTSYSLPVAAYQAYILEICIPHLGAGTTGTFTFALGGPTINLASLDIMLWTGTTLTTHTLNSASATLLAVAPAASQRALFVTGGINFSSSGTLVVTGEKNAGGSSNVTVDIGGYMRLTPVSAP